MRKRDDNLILYLGDETFEQAAEAAGWVFDPDADLWRFPGKVTVAVNAEAACIFDGIEPKGDVEVILPWRWAICPACDGHGTDRGRSVECDGGGITASEADELGDEFMEDYRNGLYDQPCGCEGGRVKVPDESKMTPEQIKAWREQLRDNAEIDAISAMERRMGA